MPFGGIALGGDPCRGIPFEGVSLGEEPFWGIPFGGDPFRGSLWERLVRGIPFRGSLVDPFGVVSLGEDPFGGSPLGDILLGDPSGGDQFEGYLWGRSVWGSHNISTRPWYITGEASL